ADLTPAGRFVATDLFAAGGTALIAKRMIEAGLLNPKAPTVTGKTIGQEAESAKETPKQEVVHSAQNPLKPTGGLVILKGNLAPEGCVIKVAGHNYQTFRGTASVFDGEEAAFAALDQGKITAGAVLGSRYYAPRGPAG